LLRRRTTLAKSISSRSLGAVDQAEAMSAIAGSARNNWRDDVGLFGTGSLFATDVGIEVLRNQTTGSPQDLSPRRNASKREPDASSMKPRKQFLSKLPFGLVGTLREQMHAVH
jgi:hypothetical protein